MSKQSVSIIILVVFICVLSASSSFGNNDNTDKALTEKSPKIDSPISLDNIDWTITEGFSLSASPEKSNYNLGEKITIKLTLKNETDMNLRYTGKNPYDANNFIIVDSNSIPVKEKEFDHGNMRQVDPILKSGKSVDQKVCLNYLFNFTSPGKYTAIAWRYIKGLDGDEPEKLYSNKFTFEISHKQVNSDTTNSK